MNRRTVQSLLGLVLAALGWLVLAVACAPTAPERGEGMRRTCAQCHPEMTAAYQTGNVHQPVKEAKCEACHLSHGLVPTVLMRQPVPVICLSCHEAFRTASSKKAVHEPVSAGKCESCHNPHNSPYPQLLKAAPPEPCYACHDRQPFTRPTVHAPLNDGCSTCHEAHMADQPGLLKQAGEALCASCHPTGTQRAPSRTTLSAGGGRPDGLGGGADVHAASAATMAMASQRTTSPRPQLRDCRSERVIIGRWRIRGAAPAAGPGHRGTSTPRTPA